MTKPQAPVKGGRSNSLSSGINPLPITRDLLLTSSPVKLPCPGSVSQPLMLNASLISTHSRFSPRPDYPQRNPGRTIRAPTTHHSRALLSALGSGAPVSPEAPHHRHERSCRAVAASRGSLRVFQAFIFYSGCFRRNFAATSEHPAAASHVLTRIQMSPSDLCQGIETSVCKGLTAAGFSWTKCWCCSQQHRRLTSFPRLK